VHRRLTVPVVTTALAGAVAVLLTACSEGVDDSATPTFTPADTVSADAAATDSGAPTPTTTAAVPSGSVRDTGTAASPRDSGRHGSDSDRPASLTDAGWAGTSTKCRHGDPWVYAAQGDPGQVVICVSDDFLYAVDTGRPGGYDAAQQPLTSVCPVEGNSPGRFVWNNSDVGWTEYDGTSHSVMDVVDGAGEMDLGDARNLIQDSYDGAWTNTGVDIPDLRRCNSDRDRSRTDRLLSQS
jgi:hypothetical protein